MKRLFLALWPSDQSRKQIVQISQSIKSEDLTLTRADNLHVTLVFLGNIDEKSELLLRKQLDHISIQPLVLCFNQLEFWRKPKILCLTAQQYDQQLILLVDALKRTAESCGLETDSRPYKPHITLARKARKLIKVNVEPLQWRADSYSLVESLSTINGIHYKVLQKWH